MISCVMSIYGFYSTNLVLRRLETSATDKSHFCSFDAPSVYLSSFSVRRPIRFRPPSDQIPSAVRSDSVRSTMTSAALFLDKHLQSLAQCYNFVRRNTNNNIINNLNEKHNYEYQVRNSRHQECQGRG